MMIILTLGIYTTLIPVSNALGIHSRLVPLILLIGLLEDSFFLFIHLIVEILVMVVPCECLLHILLVEQKHVLLDLFAILIFPLAVCVVCIEVVGIGRDKWGFVFKVQ